MDYSRTKIHSQKPTVKESKNLISILFPASLGDIWGLGFWYCSSGVRPISPLWHTCARSIPLIKRFRRLGWPSGALGGPHHASSMTYFSGPSDGQIPLFLKQEDMHA